MEVEAANGSKPASPQQRESALPWRDLRGWIAQIEKHGELARIAASVDADEEMGAVTLLASRQDKSPALIFESLKDDTTGSRILINMLGASRALCARSRAGSISEHAGNDPGHAIADDRSDPAGDDREGARAGQRSAVDRQ